MAAMSRLVITLMAEAILGVTENPPELLMTFVPNMKALCTVLPMMEDRIVRPAYARIPMNPLCLEDS